MIFGNTDKEEYDRGYEAGSDEDSPFEVAGELLAWPLQTEAYCRGYADGEKDRANGKA